MNINILNEWLSLIPHKKILNQNIDLNIEELFNKITKLNFIISFDIEFIRYVIKYKQVQTIHEMGGIIFYKNNNKWILHSIFHLNIIPLLKNKNQYYLLTSNYNTVSDKTKNKIVENEKELLPEYKINQKNYENVLLNNPIVNLYIKPKEIQILLKNKNIDLILKKIEKIKYMIKGYDLLKLPNEYQIFINNIDLILNDSDVKSREIIETNLFIKLTNELFASSYLIVKGLEDIKALKNHTILLKQNYINLKHMFDIAKYNNILFKKCNSAQLEKTYKCLENLNLLSKYKKYYDIINDFTDMKAHNPLVDAYYTFIIFIVFKLNNLNNLNNGIGSFP
jgi:hypothetical protein